METGSVFGFIFMSMMRRMLLLCCWFCCTICRAQKVQTIVPVKPVITGAAFQVQFVITGAADVRLTQEPSFEGLRVVSGPNYYRGNVVMNGMVQHVENITYTLVPETAGHFHISGISLITPSALLLKGPDAYIEAIAPSGTTDKPPYAHVTFYAPSSREALNKLISQNLFIKAQVDKLIAYVGEPVVATFTLYSRLPSFSEVIKTPGFYGFSVLDMLDINEPRIGVETLNGIVYNTSVLRKVQLYPSERGKLTIDAMHVANEIQLEDSALHTVREVNYELVSKPVDIEVRPLPADRPASFNGAVGVFAIDGSLSTATMHRNEQAKLTIKLAGKGNFIQFGAPEIRWPRGLLAQDPVITENFKKDTAPLEGQRTFEYGFTADSAGDFMIPPVEFSYFNTHTGGFVTMTTDSLSLHVESSEEKHNILPAWIHKAKRHKGMIFLWSGIGVLCLFAIAWFSKKKKAPVMTGLSNSPDYIEQLQAVDIETENEGQICTEILAILHQAFSENGTVLTPSQEAEWKSLQDECHLCIYSGVNMEGKRSELKQRALALLREAGR
jgi:BatD DUF11 like domain